MSVRMSSKEVENALKHAKKVEEFDFRDEEDSDNFPWAAGTTVDTRGRRPVFTTPHSGPPLVAPSLTPACSQMPSETRAGSTADR